MERVKKQRGLKRYYKNLTIKNDVYKIDWLDQGNPDTWVYSWHLHFDQKGYGNNSFKKRKPHLDKLFRHFDILVDKTKNIKTNFQLYAILVDKHSRSDALFLHTPNPNNSQFPFKVANLKLTTTLTNKPLNEYIGNLVGYEKRYGQAAEAFCLIFEENIEQAF